MASDSPPRVNATGRKESLIMTVGSFEALNSLAQLYGIQTSYQDVEGRTRTAHPEVLREVLQALGIPLFKDQDLKAAIIHRQKQTARRGLNPVIVFWGGVGEIEIILPAKNIPKVLEGRVSLEEGGQKEFVLKSSQIRKNQSFLIHHQPWIKQLHVFPFKLPYGYHRLELFHRNKRWEAWIFAVPPKAFQLRGQKKWGCFVPLYGLKTQNNWGSGNYTDLKRLQNWIEKKGGRVLATLPLLPTYLDKPLDPSPYAPISRLFWNEFFLDPLEFAELGISDSTQKVLSSKNFNKKVHRYRQDTLVDYQGIMALKRKVIEAVAHDFFQRYPNGNSKLRDFINKKPFLKR